MARKLSVEAMHGRGRKLTQEASLAMSDVPEPLMKTMRKARADCP